jgi:hypothetical protein
MVFFVLESAYLNDITHYFGYRKLVETSNGFFLKTLLSYGLLFLTPFLLLKKQGEYSLHDTVIFYFLVISFVPMLVLYKNSDSYPIEILIGELTLLILLKIVPKLKFPTLKSVQLSEKKIATIGTILVVLMLIPFFATFGLEININNLFLEEIYDVRLEARSRGNLYTNYTFNWLTKLFIPLLFISSIIAKSRLGLLIAVPA